MPCLRRDGVMGFDRLVTRSTLSDRPKLMYLRGGTKVCNDTPPLP